MGESENGAHGQGWGRYTQLAIAMSYVSYLHAVLVKCLTKHIPGNVSGEIVHMWM